MFITFVIVVVIIVLFIDIQATVHGGVFLIIQITSMQKPYWTLRRHTQISGNAYTSI